MRTIDSLHPQPVRREMEISKEPQTLDMEPSIDISSLNIDDSSSSAPATLRAVKLNEASKTKFQYGEPLQDKQIRLLQLHPGSDNDPLICSIILAPLEGGATSFEAVSYVWGSEDNPHPITCNWAVPFRDRKGLVIGCPHEVTNNMTVTDNLYHLLLRIRCSDGMRTLWIDQICIDQDKDPDRLQEKMAQVQMMAEVYSAASNVLIWLGEEDTETISGFGMMNWMAATIAFPEGELGSFIDYLQMTEDFSDLAEDETEELAGHTQSMEYLKSLLVHVQPTLVDGVDDPTSPDAVFLALLGSRAFAALLERPWFMRSWTFQEAVSARSATIMCGSHEVQWEVLFQACKSMRDRRMSQDGHNRINVAFAAESIIKIGDLQRDWARLQRISRTASTNTSDDSAWLNSGVFLEQRKIKRLLPLLRPTACKDPRDKVLALLGIAHDDNRWIGYPNYKWPVVNLYTSIVSYWIWGIRKMDISFLNHIQDSNPEHKLPSWVPDWSTPTIATPLIDLANFSASGDTAPVVFMDKIDYMSDLKPFPYFSPLIIEGFHIMKVQDVEADLTNCERHAEMMNGFTSPYPTTNFSYPEAYQKVMYPNIPEDFQPFLGTKGEPTFWDHINNHSETPPPTSKTSHPDLSSTIQQRYKAQDLQSCLPKSSFPIDTNSQFQHHTRAPAPGRAFFTSTAGFIGLCPRQTIPGDEIFILLGGATPFLIRVPENKIVRFVGECFVLGVMHGEALEGRPEQRQMVVMR